jgi:hypothetical protein
LEEEDRAYQTASRDKSHEVTDREMWEGEYERAIESGRQIADHITAPELAGYRAWWWHLTSVAAALLGDAAIEKDALQRSAKCGINSGWINGMLRRRHSTTPSAAETGVAANAQGIWDLLDNWGWAGPRFEEHIEQMRAQLEDQYHAAYHEGLEALGRCLGAQPTRVTEAGAPDVVWSFANDVHVAFEAKTEKKPESSLSKKDLQETKGHRDWVCERLCDGRTTAMIETVAVSESAKVHQVGLPFAGDVFHLTPTDMAAFAARVVAVLRDVRIKFSGGEFAAAAPTMSAILRNNGLDVAAVVNAVTANPLKKCPSSPSEFR